jgi:hypothetical protein
MSTTANREVECPECGVSQTILIVESANVQRFPAFKTQLLSGNFMRFTCVSCRASFVVECEMLYTDLDEHLFIGVFPHEQRGEAQACEEAIERAYGQVFISEAPEFARRAVGELRRRVVFGYEELREKVVCFAAGLDDHILEAVKVALRDSQPALGPLSLQAVAEDLLWFARVGTNEAPFAVPRAVYQEMLQDAARLESMLQPLWQGIYVSAERCLAA